VKRALMLAASLVATIAFAQNPLPTDDRFAGLQWTFARIKYNSTAGDAQSRLRLGYWEEPWAIDAPAAEQNLTRRIRTVTSIEVAEPIVITLDDEKLWQYPWIYIVEPSNLVLSDKDAATLREFLLRGGTLTLDDFHGPYEWDLTVRQLKQIFPDRDIVEIEPPHPIYSSFYKIDKYPQVPGLGSFFQGRTWEKGGFVAHLRGILDDTGWPRTHSARTAQGHRRTGRSRRSGVDGALHGRPLPHHRRAWSGEDAVDQNAR
jgi:hypothetical protein